MEGGGDAAEGEAGSLQTRRPPRTPSRDPGARLAQGGYSPLSPRALDLLFRWKVQPSAGAMRAREGERGARHTGPGGGPQHSPVGRKGRAARTPGSPQAHTGSQAKHPVRARQQRLPQAPSRGKGTDARPLRSLLRTIRSAASHAGSPEVCG